MVEVGKKIKAIRKEKEMTIKELSQLSNLSSGFLSQLERNISDASISSLKKIAIALNVKVKDFFESNGEDSLVIRKNERRKLLIGDSKNVYELLAPNIIKKMEPICKKIKPEAQSGIVEAHEGEEFVLVTQGTMQIHAGNQTYTLQEGDSLYFNANQPHSYKNIGDIEAVCIWVVTPPSLT